MKFIAFGEILFDCLEDSATLGGAPLNVAYHLKKLGADGIVVSAVGRDALGRRALREIEALGLSVANIALTDYPTGRADIVLKDKNADYTFNESAAWGFIEADDEVLRESADLVLFGSLAQRNAVSRYTLSKLLDNVSAKEVFFDVNLRKQFYSEEIILNGLRKCTILKMNEDEAKIILKLCGIEDAGEKATLEKLADQFDVRTILETAGKKGSLCYSGGKWYSLDASDVDVVDTIGAGDALSAGFLKTFITTGEAELALKVGTYLADFVVSQSGATPQYSEELIDFLKENGVI